MTSTGADRRADTFCFSAISFLVLRLEVANSLGVSFQQVQKYEKGTNRIGASRLQQHIWNIRQVPAAFFFDGAPHVKVGKNLLRRPSQMKFRVHDNPRRARAREGIYAYRQRRTQTAHHRSCRTNRANREVICYTPLIRKSCHDGAS
jgi:hypothetical protein